MTTEQDLLAAVLADPDSDVPRLIYADWLEEHGQQERAEFIRVQLELALIEKGKSSTLMAVDATRAMGRVTNDGATILRTVREWTLCERQNELMAGDDWAGGELIGLPVGYHRKWRRGFVFEVWCSSQMWLDHADQWLSKHPIKEVCLTRWWSNVDVVRYWLASKSLDFWPGDFITEDIVARLWPGITFNFLVK